MRRTLPSLLVLLAAAGSVGAAALDAVAAPAITRLTPPSELFASGNAGPPYIARFVPGQRFDLQATVQPVDGRRIESVEFAVDGEPVARVVPGNAQAKPNTSVVTEASRDPDCWKTPRPRSATDCTLVAGLRPGTLIASVRGFSLEKPGVHVLTVQARDAHGWATAQANFEIVDTGHARPVAARNLIILLGDGMGAAHRTAARIVANGYAQGKPRQPLAMDTLPHTAMIMTASLNSIVTDSAPGMQNYVTGNKAANHQEGVWPDDTLDPFDNPRVEYLAEYLARTQGRKLGIVTTADVFDATPASMTVHTANRRAGTGIVDQYLDESSVTANLAVLMGGGRKWFLPNPTPCPAPECGAATGFNGSQRSAGSDYVLPDDIMEGWRLPDSARGARDPGRDLLADYQSAGFTYVRDRSALAAVGTPEKLLGLFALSNMNVAMDKIEGRRGLSKVVTDFGFPDQPMLEEMTQKALDVLDAHSPNGFVLLVEGASIDKQAHQMDAERWIGDTIELDRAVAVAKAYAAKHPDTLVIVTADHECSGAAIIGASTVTDTTLKATKGAALRDPTVGAYELAKFPRYTIAPDGYPASYDPDYKLLIGYAAGVDHFEDWSTNPEPAHDSQQPGDRVPPLSTYPALNDHDNAEGRPIRDQAGGYFVPGQITGDSAAHTGVDVPLSALGRGAALFAGTLDNTDVFFLLMRAALGSFDPEPAR
jgi:alkaline phosphatase